MTIEWTEIEKEFDFENLLFNTTEQCIKEFMKINKNLNETFYAFAFDYGTQHSHLGLCFNTVEYYKNLISKYPNYTENEKFEFKYNTGNWKFQSFNKGKFTTINNIWEQKISNKLFEIHNIFDKIQFDNSVDEEVAMEKYETIVNGYEKSLRKVINKIKENLIFNELKTTTDFKIYYIDFYDNILDIYERIMN